MSPHTLITYALPYANAPLHLGHMLGFVVTDIYVRFLRARGESVTWISGEDTHGTPIMLHAQKRGITPEALIAEMAASHQADLQAFGIALDAYGSTHDATNRLLVERIYRTLASNGCIRTRTIAQAYDEKVGMFLPDRYVKGECPRCAAPDQYGDSCEVCGSTYGPLELRSPRSVLTGTEPSQKESVHYFFSLPQFSAFLQEWMQQADIIPEVRRKLQEWFNSGLKEWDISRDAPYFGFEIPDSPGKFFYVWLDAPLGYLATTEQYGTQVGDPDFFARHWEPQADSTPTRVEHWIGKDIVYFHALFWPALLHAAGLRTPDAIVVHGYLTVQGKKMSKSRGTFILAEAFAKVSDPEALRYYFASKWQPGIGDLDFDSLDFVQKVNADLVGKWANIAARATPFLTRYFDGKLAEMPEPSSENPAYDSVWRAVHHAFESCTVCMATKQYQVAVRHVMELAEAINRFFDAEKPWVHIKSNDEAVRRRVQEVCTLTLNAFLNLSRYLRPVLPERVAQVARWWDLPPLAWRAPVWFANRPIAPYTPLIQRLSVPEDLSVTTPEASSPKESSPAIVGVVSHIDIAHFAAVDLRVARIVLAEAVPGADKLLRLRLDTGETGEKQVFAGIKPFYNASDLPGKLVVWVANLAPRTMRFGVSEGMVLAASGPDKQSVFLISPDTGAQIGMRVQ